MIDRNYLPYQTARDYRDSGMQKWMGFFLSEHVTSLEADRKKEDLSSSLSRVDVLILLGQLYQHQAQGAIVLKQRGQRKSYQGMVSELGTEAVTLRTSEGYRRIPIDDILELSLVEVLDESEGNL